MLSRHGQIASADLGWQCRASVLISPPELCPTSLVHTFRDGNKKIDYALALELTQQEEQKLKNAVTKYRIPGAAGVNQTQSKWTAFVPMFQYTEVKVDGSDPLIQLAIWVCAEVEKRHREGYTLDLPLPLIAISEEYWEFWIAYSEEVPINQRQPGGKPYRVQFLGPKPMGYTGDATGVFKILHVLKAIVRWGLEIYEPAFMEHVFGRYNQVWDAGDDVSVTWRFDDGGLETFINDG